MDRGHKALGAMLGTEQVLRKVGCGQFSSCQSLREGSDRTTNAGDKTHCRTISQVSSKPCNGENNVCVCTCIYIDLLCWLKRIEGYSSQMYGPEQNSGHLGDN